METKQHLSSCFKASLETSVLHFSGYRQQWSFFHEGNSCQGRNSTDIYFTSFKLQSIRFSSLFLQLSPLVPSLSPSSTSYGHIWIEQFGYKPPLIRKLMYLWLLWAQPALVCFAGLITWRKLSPNS